MSAVSAAVEATVYGSTVALATTAALAVLLVPFGSAVALKTGLFVVGWLAFGAISIRLFAGRSRDTAAGRTRFDRTVALIPPLRWYWREDEPPVSTPLSRQFAAAFAILGVSALLEFGLGIGV